MIPRLCLALFLLAGPRAWAAVDRLDALARLPVQEGGRVMPMDSFARLHLLQFSGRSTFEKKPAIEWLARVLFAPDATDNDKIFLVNHPEVLEALGVEGDGRGRHSYAELSGSFEKLTELAQAASTHEESDRTPVMKEVLRLHHSITAYMGLRYSFEFARPHGDFAVTNELARARLGLEPDAGPSGFLDVYRKAQLFADDVQKLASVPQADWTAEQQAYFTLSSALFQWSQFYRGLPPAMFPIRAHGAEQWVSPWDLIGFGLTDDAARSDIDNAQKMARAYVAGSQLEFDMAAHAIEVSVLDRAEPSRSMSHIDTELRINRLQPFYRAEVVYGLSLLLALGAMMGRGATLRRIALGGVLLALIPHTLGLAWRMMIMGRPPMTNLYATFLFVSWVCVILGLAIEWAQRNGLGTVLSAAGGLVLLMVSDRFAVSSDTLGVVVAVLDSNFWLATHVVTITMGYAGCLAAGLAGHIYLMRAVFRKPDDPVMVAIERAVYGLLAFGLILSFLGTMLGGVWADQSWGRFWGWDPKENGALLIVLWCAILFHARIANMLGPIGIAAGAVLGVIVVLMAWIGINLLGVGLHSYGFISGLALGLWTSIAIEIGFLVFTVPLARRRAADQEVRGRG